MKSGQDAVKRPAEVFGLFRGLDIPFDKAVSCQQYSPILGLNKRVLRNLRLYGHYGVEERCHYLLPSGHSTALDPLFAQDALAALIKLLFPSMAGLVVNTSSSDKTNDYLTPKHIARIFMMTHDAKFYDNEDTVAFRGKPIALSMMRLIELMMPPKMLSKWKKSAKFGSDKFVVSPAEEKSLDFIVELSKLLHDAFVENVGLRAMRNGVTHFIVEQALLCYMWERNKHNKKNILPYYQEFVSAGLIRKEHVDAIIWEGDDSCYTEMHYRKAEAATELEKSALMGLGRYYFDDKFPPAVEFGICRAVIDKAPVLYADCGDTSIRNFFMMMLYNPVTKKFDVSKLFKIQEHYAVRKALIQYFVEVCTCPAEADTAWSRDKWALVVNGLPYVRYLKAVYEINAGLDNALMVIGALLGVYIEISRDMSRYVCIEYLDKICGLFSIGDEKWRVSLSPYAQHPDSIDDYYEAKIGHHGWVDLSATFSYGKEKVFEWHFESNHFALNRCTDICRLKQKFYDIDDFASEFFADKMDTPIEKVIAIDQIANYKMKTGMTHFDYLLNQWLEKSGKHFAGWKNLAVNARLVTVLLKYMSISHLIELAIPELLSSAMSVLVKMRRMDDIKVLLNEDAVLFEREMRSNNQSRKSFNLFPVFQPPSHEDKFAIAGRVLCEILRQGSASDVMILHYAGASEYLQKIWGMSLLHLVVLSGNDGLVPVIGKLQQDVQMKNEEGNTPLHFAAKAGSLKMVKELIVAGADVSAVNKGGKSALELAFNAYQFRERCLHMFFHGIPPGLYDETTAVSPFTYDQALFHVDSPFPRMPYPADIIDILKANDVGLSKHTRVTII